MRCVWAAVLFAGTASATAGEICYSDPYDATVATPPTGATFFNCPVAGRKTIGELAAAGYAVVKLSPTIVGQAGPVFQGAHQLIIELPEKVFAHGFEN